MASFLAANAKMSQASDVAQDTQGQTPVISSESVEGIGEYVKERDGRKFTNNPETTYQLPAGEFILHDTCILLRYW